MPTERAAKVRSTFIGGIIEEYLRGRIRLGAREEFPPSDTIPSTFHGTPSPLLPHLR
jgi:hypothetical protein